MTFQDVIGQQATIDRLLQMEREARLPHALMLCGPDGCGKMAVALAWACHLLGDGPMLRNYQHPDLHFSFPTVKKDSMSGDHQPVSDDFISQWRAMISRNPYFTFTQWMEAIGAASKRATITVAEADDIARKLRLKSSQGGYKICIIWQPERMHIAAANKLLKLLEEPPSQTMFILVSDQPELILETIVSRTQRIDMKRIAADDIRRALVEQRGLDDDMAQQVARTASGSWNKALEELDAGNENLEFFDLFVMLMRRCYMREIADLKKWSENVATFGREKQHRMLTYFVRMVRENFMFNFQLPDLSYMTTQEQAFASKFARFINEANVIDMMSLFERCDHDLQQNANAKIVFFDMTMQVILLLNRT